MPGKTILNAVPVGIVTCSKTGQCLSANQAAASLADFLSETAERSPVDTLGVVTHAGILGDYRHGNADGGECCELGNR